MGVALELTEVTVPYFIVWPTLDCYHFHSLNYLVELHLSLNSSPHGHHTSRLSSPAGEVLVHRPPAATHRLSGTALTDGETGWVPNPDQTDG